MPAAWPAHFAPRLCQGAAEIADGGCVLAAGLRLAGIAASADRTHCPAQAQAARRRPPYGRRRPGAVRGRHLRGLAPGPPNRLSRQPVRPHRPPVRPRFPRLPRHRLQPSVAPSRRLPIPSAAAVRETAQKPSCGARDFADAGTRANAQRGQHRGADTDHRRRAASHLRGAEHAQDSDGAHGHRNQ